MRWDAPVRQNLGLTNLKTVVRSPAHYLMSWTIQLLVQLWVEELDDWKNELEVDFQVLMEFDVRLSGFLELVDIAFEVGPYGVVAFASGVFGVAEFGLVATAL